MPDKPTTEAEWESIRQSCEATDSSRPRIYDAIRSGGIIAKKFGAKTLVNVASRRAYFDALPDLQLPKKRVQS
jgi:hypothetical protein